MINHKLPRTLVVIGFDAFDVDALSLRLDQGRLANLAGLRARSNFTRLDPDTPGFGGMSWLSFINGRPLGEHGWYFSKVWRPHLGRIEQASTEFLRLHGFWQPLIDRGQSIGLIDVPYAPDPAAGFKGCYLNGWQTHDVEPLRSHPAGLLSEIKAKFGPPILDPEHYGPQHPADLIRIHQNVVEATRQMGDIAAWLLEREAFDLFMMVFGATHRAGHYLWNLSQTDRTKLDASTTAALEQAVDEVYRECDNALGKIIEAAPHAEFAVFSPHGMGVNSGWNDILADILRMLNNPTSQQESALSIRRYLNALRRAPLTMRVTRHLPAPLSRALGQAWSSNMHDWSKTKFFALPSEVVGMVRFNVIGREPQGIISETDLQAERDALAEQVSDIRDLDCGRPIVSMVHRTDDLVPSDAPFRQVLPDLALEWSDLSITDSVGVRLPNGQELRWPQGRKISSGRSGDHRQSGWVMGDIDIHGQGNQAPTTVDLARGLRESVTNQHLPEMIDE